MTELTLEAFIIELDKRIKPVSSNIARVEDKVTNQEKNIKKLSERLDKVEKLKNPRPAKQTETPLSTQHTPAKSSTAPGAMAYNQVVQQSPPVRDKEGLTAALEEEEKKKLEPGYKPKRHRDMDYSNRMAATPDQRMRYEENYEFAYLCIGLNPNGTDSDRERCKDEMMEKNGGVEPAEKELEWYMIDEYLRKDMGMDDEAVRNVRHETEKWFFEGDTSFLKFYSRDGVALVRAWSNMLNRMAAERCVTRKLHIYCPPQLESRFFALKNLEWTYRNLRKKKDGQCMTRICYRDRTIWAQFKIKYEDEYEDIEEPRTAKIPTVEFWRVTSHPRLNSRSRSRGRGRGISRPAQNAPIPAGRDRPDEVRGRGRGQRGHRGSVPPRLPPGSGLSLTEEAAARASQSHNDDAMQGLNSNAVSRNDGQSTKGLTGGSTMTKAGKTNGSRGRGGRRAMSVSQSNTMLSYIGTPERTKRSRSQRDQDDGVEAEKLSRSQRPKTEEVNKTEVRVKRPSPTKEELDKYVSIAKKLHKSGAIELVAGSGGSLGQARMIEKMKLSAVLDKEKDYYSHLKKRIKAGQGDYDKTDLHLDSSMFKAERRKILNTLSDLNDHTLETMAVDTTLETSEDTDSEVFTESTEDTEAETETETEKEDGPDPETLEITIF